MSDDRPAVYWEDDRLVCRASASGHCIRALVAHGIGLTPEKHPDWLLKKFDEGNVGEDTILKMVEDKYNMMITDRQAEFELAVGSKVLIRCHIDGIGTQNIAGVGHDVVVEAKAITVNTLNVLENKGIEEMYYMAVQLSLEMAMTGKPGLLACGIKDEDGKVEKLETYSFEEPPVPLGSIKAKMLKLARYVDEGVLPDCDYAQYPCQFFYLHDGQKLWAGKEISKVEDEDEAKEWDQAAAQYDSANRAEKQIKERKKEASERLAKLFDQAGKKGGEVEIVGYVINDVVFRRKVLNTKKMKEDGIKVDEYMEESENETRYPKIEYKEVSE